MKRKFLFSIVIALVLIFALASCSSNDRYSNEGGYEEATESDEIDTNFLLNQSNRKIIYTFNINMVSDEFDKTADKIYELVQEDEEAANWIQESERYQNDNYRHLYLTVRVKTDNLNDFLTGLASVGEISNQSHSTKDITYSYASTQARISALEDEKQYLEDILDEVAISEKLLYIERISDINSELMLLNETLTNYDSDVEYSTVNIHLTDTAPTTQKTSFGEKLKDAFWGSINFVYEALKWLLIAFIYILPFAIIGTIVTVVVVLVKKKIKSRTKKDKSKDIESKK